MRRLLAFPQDVVRDEKPRIRAPWHVSRADAARVGCPPQLPLACLADRPSVVDGGRPASGDRQGGRPRGLLLGRAFVDRVRHAGDPDHPGDGGDGGAVPRDADLSRDRRAAGDRHLLLRTDDPRLPRRWRCLHRRPRQRRQPRGAGGGRSAADGLHPDGGRLHLVRRRADHVRLPHPVRAQGGAGGRARRLRDDREPARCQGVRCRVRRADLLLRRHDAAHRRDRPGPAGGGNPAPDPRPASARHRADAHARAVPGATRLLEWHDGAHGRRSNLERHPGLQGAAQPQRRDHAALDVRHPGDAVPRDQLPGRADRGGAVRARDGRSPSWHARPSRGEGRSTWPRSPRRR